MHFFELRNCNTNAADNTAQPGFKGNFGAGLKDKVSSFLLYGEGGCVNIDQSGY